MNVCRSLAYASGYGNAISTVQEIPVSHYDRRYGAYSKARVLHKTT